jgi:hypothetical protein
LVCWIITDDQPFTTVQNIYFQKMIKRLNSEVTMVPSADTIHDNAVKLFKAEKENIKKELQVYIIYIVFLLLIANILLNKYFVNL